MKEFIEIVIQLATAAGSRLLLALIVFLIGRAIIKRILYRLEHARINDRIDPTVHLFAKNATKVVLYLVLIVSIIGILGVPMASIVTVLATAGVAIGMSLQGSLGNLAGGIMMMIFRPFNVGDYVSTVGAEGTVKEINLFYTVMTTKDNRRIIIPNGSLMNANVTNYSAEPQRRVDLTFSCAKGEDIALVENTILSVLAANEKILKEDAPEEPVARIAGNTNEAMEFTVKAWCRNEDYWDVYYALTKDITEALTKAGIKAPGIRIIQ